jgi:hypothetical protein
MSRTILALSAAVLICVSSQFAYADESGAVTGAVGGAVAGALLAVRSVRSWVGLAVQQSEIP